MITAYHQLLHFHNEHRSVTATISAFGQHFDIYCGQIKIGMVPYSEEDKCCIINYNWKNVHPLARHIPVKNFLAVLVSAASQKD